MSAPKVAIIKFGYQDFAVPAHRVAALLDLLPDLQKLESSYVPGEGYVYWPTGDDTDEHTVTLVPAGRIKPTKPADPPKVQPVAAVTPPDTRIVTAPTSSEPISVKSVPPMREFVDEFRHEDFAA